jgi:FAD/FMN-containing dehydrogenase
VALGAAALAALRKAVTGSVTDSPESIERFAQDASPLRTMPAAAVAPSDREDVIRLIQWAREFRVPIVARGGGSSLDGESVPVPGGVIVDFSGWTDVREIDGEDRLVRVAPGVRNRELHRTLAPSRLFFPPNPGSWEMSTIGGNVATNASGPRSFRYGPTRTWVRGLEVVLGSGDLLRLGHRARKSATGPDLLGFLVGSEGTLGLFTEATLALAPSPERRLGLVVPCAEGRSLGSTLRQLLAPPAPALSAIEYIDRATAEPLAREAGARLPPDRALLLLELEAAAANEEAELARADERLRSLGFGEDVSVYPDADELWTLRGRSGVVLDHLLGPRVREDIAVPWSRLDELVAGCQAIARRYSAPLYLYGHLGDGNLHPNFRIDPAEATAHRIRRDVLLLAKRLGGTLSAEHGIGRLKAPYLGLEHGPAGVRLLRSIKTLCDPDAILNPGKLYPPPSDA